MTEIDLNDSAKQVNGISTGDVAQKKDMSIVSEERYTPGYNTNDTDMNYFSFSF